MSIPTPLAIAGGACAVLAGLYLAGMWATIHLLTTITDDGIGDL